MLPVPTIQGCFYAVDCPPGLADFFCLKTDLNIHEASFVTGGKLSFEGFERIIPCIKVLPMGFNWSFYLIQALHEQTTIRSLGIGRDSLVIDGQCPPRLREGACIAMPYCDNVHTLSYNKEDCQRGCGQVCADLSDMGFVLHEEAEASTSMETVRGMINGKSGQVRATPRRTWRIIMAFEYMLRATVSVEMMQRLLGHAMTLCVLNRAWMSVFRRLYDFIERGGGPRYLNKQERIEVEMFIGIAPLLIADMRQPFADVITATDASPEGYGVCESVVGDECARCLGEWNERGSSVSRLNNGLLGNVRLGGFASVWRRFTCWITDVQQSMLVWSLLKFKCLGLGFMHLWLFYKLATFIMWISVFGFLVG